MSRLATILLAILVPSGSITAQAALVDPDVVAPVREVTIDDTDLSDLAPLGEAIGDARIVVLGEATHSEGSTSRAKAAVVRYLHERMGFDVLAWEAGLLDAMAVDEALRDTVPVAEAATHLMRGGWDATVDARPVFVYARRTWSTDRPLRMAGFDTGRPPRGAAHVERLLERLLDRAPELDPGRAAADRILAMARATYSYIGQDTATLTEAEREARRAALRELAGRLERLPGPIAARFSPAELLRYRTSLRAVLDDERIHEVLRAGIRSHDPDANLRWNRLRDSVMASRVITLADSLYPDRKIVIWAATAHFIRNSETIEALDSEGYGTYPQAGDRLAEHLGDELYTIGFVAHEGTYGDEFPEGHRLFPGQTGPLPMGEGEGFEQAMHDLGVTHAFVDLRGAPDGHPLRGRFVAHALGYLRNRARWAQILDGFYFIDRAEPERHHPN